MDERKLTAVEERENELYHELYMGEGYDLYFGDLTLHYMEIIREIAKRDREKSCIIFDYAKLLEQEIQYWSGTDAYISGQEAKETPEIKVLIGIDRKVSQDEGKQKLDYQIQTRYNEIHELLGETSGLLRDFTDLFIRTHGVIKNNLSDFIRLGQTADVA